MTDDAVRRDATRVSVVMELQYRSAGHLLVSYCTNLSRGGLFVASDAPSPAGTHLTLEIAIPGQDEPSRIQAEVRWVRQVDAAEGPAGMGLAFSNVDPLLGERIDGLVAQFEPLTVHVVGDNVAIREYVAAQVRALVSCTTAFHDAAAGSLPKMTGADLVIVDSNADPEGALALLKALSLLDQPPPRVALCHAAVSERHSALARVSRVISTPVDTAELRECVLDALAQVYAAPTR